MRRLEAGDKRKRRKKTFGGVKRTHEAIIGLLQVQHRVEWYRCRVSGDFGLSTTQPGAAEATSARRNTPEGAPERSLHVHRMARRFEQPLHGADHGCMLDPWRDSRRFGDV
mmetsp:Transcript_12875/g.29365  ORF Transcript_12875/g.29365 Transcript_12875/m.29365 type:complete len:111 (-) Transcript_12875:56-388(-)